MAKETMTYLSGPELPDTKPDSKDKQRRRYERLELIGSLGVLAGLGAMGFGIYQGVKEFDKADTYTDKQIEIINAVGNPYNESVAAEHPEETAAYFEAEDQHDHFIDRGNDASRRGIIIGGALVVLSGAAIAPASVGLSRMNREEDEAEAGTASPAES